MRTDDEKAAFETAIAENPYDGVTRKVFADWLEEHGFDDAAVLQREWTAEKMRAAEKYVRDFAEACGISQEELLTEAERFLDDGEEVLVGAEGVGMAYSSYPEFWEHFMILTGRPVPSEQRQAEFISCAC